MAQTTSLVFNGGVIPSPSPAPTGSGKAKLLKIGEITVTEQEVQVTKKVICDPDSITTVAPFMEVLTSAKLAELVNGNNILVLDDGTNQYLMSDASVSVEDGTAVCTAVNFLGLSKENRAKVLYPCTRITDELTLHQVLEVGEPVVTGFDLVKAYPEDTEAGTLIDKLMVEDTVVDDPDDTLLKIVPSEDSEGHPKVAINEDALKTFSGNVIDSIETLTELINERPSDEHGYFNSSLYTTPGDGTTTNLVMGDFRISENRDVHGDSIEFVPTHQEGGVDFGEVWLEPGTYILATQITLQWVGNPRGTFLPLVANVADQPFDFSYEHEDVIRTTRIITMTTRGKLVINIAIDADTPPMGVWVKNLEVAQIASLTQSNVVHDTTLTGTGKVADPLGVTPAAFGKIKDIPTSISQFRNGDVIPVDGPNGPAKMSASELQDAILGGPVDEAVQAWLGEHPEATTTVQNGSLSEIKFSDALKLQTIKDYATPEMFGAVGDGVTDDTDAFTAMVAASNKYLLTKKYVVSGVIISKTFNMLGLSGCSLIANDNAQEYILRLDSGNENCIIGVKFDGKGSSFPDARGNVVGVLLNAKSSSEFLMERCVFNYCKIGLFAPKTFWHSKVSLCRFNGCGYGISINSPTGDINQTYLELLFSQIYCNQCDLHIYLAYGSNITFNECSFGSELVLTGSTFFRTLQPVHNLVFRSCNFEGILVKDGMGAFMITAYCRGIFEDCQFHLVSPVQDVSPSNVSLFWFAMSGANRVSFRRCRFGSISIHYMFNCPTGSRETFDFDYITISAISGAFSRRFDAKNVYPSSVHIFNISDIPLLPEVPNTTPWNSELNTFFRGVVIRINKTLDFYMWNGSSWEKLVYVPQPASDENTYTLKNVAGTLTWVQDT